MSRILIVEDELVIRAALKRLLEKHSYTVDDAGSVAEALPLTAKHHYDLIISDLRLPGAQGTDLIAHAGTTPVLIMTSYASMRSAIDAIKMGAAEYIAKPFSHEEMLAVIAKLIQPDETEAPAPNIIKPLLNGSCEPIQDLIRRINKIASTNATVLILGESGTGKELAAKSIHQQSSRAASPMVCVNCAAIPETLIESELFGHEKGAFTGADTPRSGLIEAADGGTLFLDEIGELPLEAQARLLRFLQEGEIRRVGSVHAKRVDVRLIAATHRDLKTLAQEGRFREDLYYRLYVMELKMPPLRERGEDIIELSQVFLKEQCSKHHVSLSFSPAAVQTMLQHTWPGNVRELQNAIERAVILADNHTITPELLGLDTTQQTLTPSEPHTATPAQPNKAEHTLDDYFLKFVLENQHLMNETDLAKSLGVSRKCLWEKRQKLGIPRKSKNTAQP
ncbi:sigma-54-dependent transcriptional regulator [Nitrincola iocasae]|uniref:Sigma-54-dependent Fis family transcriptional regulator n=1 Tax=Nitrincola iocasae TaxID=2614693 RepID=A0A5J6LA85_9GAMM|nr:sigma-54 dependent transcriptional regulator [Nitrincola iocasae]QEW05519.1 sigma-54-dependent Fis family transcriptional regulator [Nitrincola iocasae]